MPAVSHSVGAVPCCNMAIFISGEVVKSVASMKDVVDVVEKGLLAFSTGGVVQPVRSVVPVAEHGGFLGLMPSYCYAADALATKLITLYPNNMAKGVPSHQAVVLLMSASTGTPLALIDGDSITAMRTAAASAVALKYMKPSSPPKVLCIIGTGVQARSHIEALRIVQEFHEIRIWGRNTDKAAEVASDVGGENVKVFNDIQAACSGADVIVTVTMATEPILFGSWLKNNCIVLGIGACRPDWRELDGDIISNGLIVVDSKEAALKEAGDIILGNGEIFCEVGDLVNNGPLTSQMAHSKGKKFFVFKSLGIGVEDAVTAKLVYDKYKSNQS